MNSITPAQLLAMIVATEAHRVLEHSQALHHRDRRELIDVIERARAIVGENCLFSSLIVTAEAMRAEEMKNG